METRTGTFVRQYTSTDGAEYISHLDGVPWTEAPIPWRWHRCWVQTQGRLAKIGWWARCACGAIKSSGKPSVPSGWLIPPTWIDRNSRRRHRKMNR